MRIVIDPGIWNDTWKTQDILLSIANNLYDKLHSRGHEVLMTRSKASEGADAGVSQGDLFIGLYATPDQNDSTCKTSFFCRLASNSRGEAVRQDICKRMAELPGIARINICPLRVAELKAVPAAVVMIQFCFPFGSYSFTPAVLAETIGTCIADNL
ncbi:MAG TPA: hypothetical protein DCP36_00800 [Sporomusaceae bacterium]|uniref:hypothetical protein n=1 Tax=Anaerospora sp. TaxID=1960278 RepID=UPI000ED39428|nr:hypothetical protein [Anaerospora sp.]HAK72461.1 hypothetical protein [Sporomusaceae bacterium]